MTRFRLCVLPLAGLLLAGGACSDSHPTLEQEPINGPPITIDPDPTTVPPASECEPGDLCEDGDPCTENRCVEGQCAAAPIPAGECCDVSTLFADTFDAGQTALGLTQLTPSAGWTLSERRAASPPTSLYFGNDDFATYGTGERVAGTATLPIMSLPPAQESVLRFRAMALIEPSKKYDKFWIEADILEGDAGNQTIVETVELMDKGDLPGAADKGFALVEVPLEGLEGKTIRVRLEFDTLDELNNDFEGLYIDDLQLLATCPLLDPCELDPECDDGDECTADLCSAEGCVYDDICEEPGPITDPTIEDPTEPEPVDPGAAAICEAPDAPEDCCTSDADCDDGDATTINVCEGATCVETPNPDACTSDSMCNDQDLCTADTCSGGLCEYTGTFAAGCCVPGDEILADFDKGTLSGVYVTDNLETGLFWQTDKTRATSGDYSLYMGDPVAQSYGHERRVKASATTPVLELPSGGDTKLTFDLFKATRKTKHLDVLQVFVLRKGALLPAWTSKSLKDGTTSGTWSKVTVPLTQYAGQTIQLRFVFDTVTTPPPGLEGVYIDSLSLETQCK